MAPEQFNVLHPILIAWIKQTVDCHRQESRPVPALGFHRLPRYFGPELLSWAKVVVVNQVPAPPLVRTTDLAPVAGVELDDSSHERADRKKRDVFVDEVFRTCKLPLLHVPAQASYNTAELRAPISATIAH